MQLVEATVGLLIHPANNACKHQTLQRTTHTPTDGDDSWPLYVRRTWRMEEADRLEDTTQATREAACKEGMSTGSKVIPTNDTDPADKKGILDYGVDELNGMEPDAETLAALPLNIGGVQGHLWSFEEDDVLIPNSDGMRHPPSKQMQHNHAA